MKRIDENIMYDKEKDTSYIICRKCGEKVYLGGVFEYGLLFDCKCGYSLIAPEK